MVQGGTTDGSSLNSIFLTGGLFCSRLIFRETRPVVLRRTARPYNDDLPLPHDMESAVQKLQFCLLRAILLTLKNLSEQIWRGKQSHSGINVINRYLFAMKYNLTTYLYNNQIVTFALNSKRLEGSMPKSAVPRKDIQAKKDCLILALPNCARLYCFTIAKKLSAYY